MPNISRVLTGSSLALSSAATEQLSLSDFIFAPYASLSARRSTNTGLRVAYDAARKLPAPEVPEKVLSVREIVISFRDGGMPVSAIAEIARVERKTVYAWLNGTEVRDGNAKRMTLIYGLLSEALPGISIRNIYRFWNIKVFGTKTLRDILSEEEIDRAKAANTIGTLLPAAKRNMSSEIKPVRQKISNPILEDIPEISID